MRYVWVNQNKFFDIATPIEVFYGGQRYGVSIRARIKTIVIKWYSRGRRKVAEASLDRDPPVVINPAALDVQGVVVQQSTVQRGLGRLRQPPRKTDRVRPSMKNSTRCERFTDYLLGYRKRFMNVMEDTLECGRGVRTVQRQTSARTRLVMGDGSLVHV